MRTDWPCPGCITRIPGSADASRPMPLLVMFHGNDGNTHWMDRIWHDPVARHGMIELVLKCPGYGFPSWWRWHESAQHDPGWLRARLGEVAREVPIDMTRVYGTGYSGGASYLSAYITSDPSLFAAVSLVAGGVPARACPTRAVPAHVLVGSVDTMLTSNVIPFREAWTRCGGEVEWDERAGVTHEGILWNVERGGAEAIVGWLLGKVEARRAAD